MQPTETAELPRTASARRRLHGQAWIALAVFGTIGAVVVAPFTHGGWLLLLDWVQGPQQHLPPSFWGLGGGLTAALPFQLVVIGASRLVGASLVSWFVVWLFFPVGGAGMARLFRNPLSGIVAGLCYVLSPFVYERIWAGHVSFLLGFACFPWFVASLHRIPAAPRRWPIAALWMAILIGLAPHFLFICGVYLACFAVYYVRNRRVLLSTVGVVIGAIASSLYLIVGSYNRYGSVAVTLGDLRAFRTTGDATFGLYLNVLAGYGFWRREPLLPKDDVAGWPILLGALLLVCAAAVLPRRKVGRLEPLTIVALLSAGAGYVLALGNRGIAGSTFQFLFNRVPGFRIMREPQKFSLLLVFGLALLFGNGIEHMSERVRTPTARRAFAVVAVAIPLAYNPSLFLGLRHRLRLAHYPASWAAANRLMGSGSGRILVLPWHLYMGFGFTDGRIIANPTSAVFTRQTIFGDSPDLPTLGPSQSPRSQYLQYVYSRGNSLHHFGALSAPLGVEYVVLLKTADWRAFNWLDQQADLTKVFDASDIAVFRNTEATPTGASHTAAMTVPSLSEFVDQVEGGYRGAAFVDGKSTTTTTTEPAHDTLRALRRATPTKYRTAGAPSVAIVPETYAPAWRANDRAATADAHGLAAVAGGARTITYHFWIYLMMSYVFSCLALVALVSFSSGVGVRNNRVC